MAQVTAVGHTRGTGQPVPWQLGSLHSRVTQGTGEGLDEGAQAGLLSKMLVRLDSSSTPWPSREGCTSAWMCDQ